MENDRQYMEYYSRIINEKLSSGSSIADIKYEVEQFNKHFDNLKKENG
tara:strand:- start:2847 stop:2990 length:144 start_codon:yes stop_codon:yes gene_type:complete